MVRLRIILSKLDGYVHTTLLNSHIVDPDRLMDRVSYSSRLQTPEFEDFTVSTFLPNYGVPL